MSKYKQLDQDIRCQINTLKKIGFNQLEIANEVGVHKSTISRELRRNKGDKGYRYKQAHKKALKNRSSASKALK